MLAKWKIKKRHTLNTCGAIGLIVAVYFICYMLWQDDIFPISISSAWHYFSQWTKHFHVVAVALLPVYIALMIFGTAILGMYLGSTLQRWISQFLRSK